MKRRGFLKLCGAAIPALLIPTSLFKPAILAPKESLIQVPSEGLEPELEKILYEIVEKCQQRANDEGLDSLLDLEWGDE